MGFLEQIVRESHRSLEDPGYGTSLTPPIFRKNRTFRQAVEEDQVRGALVVEYKRTSPGHAEPNLPARSVKQFLDATRPARPSAYSCLATIPRFGGSPSDVAELASSTDRPVLFKDFIVDRRQIHVAALCGASAVLLIARLADGRHLSSSLESLADEAHRLGLEVLVEFHERSELSRAADLAADVYGVNARNLDSLAIERETATETLRAACERGLRPLLGLSGVADPSDAGRFWAEGVDGILVGSAVALAPDPAAFLATLRRPTGEVPG